ncbi:hypothetical Protein YC6258_01791 [Gynuella sunshinyii YC6258]|uniref:Uncharacterized protein n=1 Tax=Gynuella sunshinyii YC6258 TaxID=1445510 RepID=A0A0C5V2V8_9GAMM|nr:hypothetical Protein YC6258_01791 [Gynuella sunshinyii YC6258]
MFRNISAESRQIIPNRNGQKIRKQVSGLLEDILQWMES